MKGLVFANLHLFKNEQQKSLQQGRLEIHAFLAYLL